MSGYQKVCVQQGIHYKLLWDEQCNAEFAQRLGQLLQLVKSILNKILPLARSLLRNPTHGHAVRKSRSKTQIILQDIAVCVLRIDQN